MSTSVIAYNIEEQLKKLELVVSNVANAIMICDHNGDIEWVNNGFTELTGYLPEEVLGKDPFESLYSSLSNKEIGINLHNRIVSGETIKETILNHKSNGDPYWLELIVKPILDGTGTLKNYIVIGIDVNDRMKSSKEIEERANLLESISEAMPVVTYIWNIEKYKLDFISNHIFDLTGYSKEEFLNDETSNKFISIALENDVQKLRESYARIINNPEVNSTSNSFRIKHRSGEIKRVNSREIVYKRNHNGKATHLICTMNDVTEQYNVQTYKEAVSRLQELQQKRTQKIRSLTMLQAQEKERKRLSRELHDGIGQMLTAIKIKINNIEEVKKNSTLEKQLIEIKELVLQTIKETRNISNALVPIDLHDFGIQSSIKQLCESLQNHSKINIGFTSNLGDVRLDPTIEIEVYRIAQEALNNSIKYSNSKNIDVNIIYNSDTGILKLLIIDEGVGFEYLPEIANKGGKTGSFGIRNMNERARIINGKLNIITQLGQGCVIALDVPIKQNDI